MFSSPQKVSDKRNSFLFPVTLCWLVYTASYLGRYSYTANITPIIDFFQITRADAGLITSFFFFSYGVGQILNGVLCKYYPKRIVVASALILSAIINIAIYLGVPFAAYKFLWLANGICLSMLWPSLVLMLSQSLSSSDLTKSAVIMSSTVPVGTLLAYGASSMFVRWGNFKLSFMVASIAMLITAAVWFISYPKAFTDLKATEKNAATQAPNSKFSLSFLKTILILGFFAVGCNLVKDGLGTWVPAILKENFGLSDSLSILLTLLLPVISFFSAALDARMMKRDTSFIKLSGLWFFLAALLIGLVILTINTSLWWLILLFFGLISLFAHGINTLITSLAPLHMRDQINSGLLTGILNGCCYMGSAISSYGLGSVADKTGWAGVFWLLFSICACNVLLAVLATKTKHR